MPISYFFDTSVVLKAHTDESSAARSYFDLSSRAARKVTNQFVLKELRRLPRTSPELGLVPHEIEELIVDMQMDFEILPTSTPDVFKRLVLVNGADRPIVQGAMSAAATLLTRDRRLATEARAYVQVIKVP